MIRVAQNIPTLIFLLIATTLEVSGDALIRIAIYKHVGLTRIALMVTGATLLFGYGSRPLYHHSVHDLAGYQFVAFRTLPSLAIVAGGALIMAGGLIITFWRPEYSSK